MAKSFHMHKGFLKISVIVGALSVALGAFGAHALKGMISNDAIAIFETGVRYQFYHVFALLATAILYKDFPFSTTVWAGRLFITGIILFSGSLYVLTAIKGAVIPGYDFIGAFTPFGGVSFIAGWLCLLVSFFGKRQS
jgi:uncharacterized membrane protein YgdD (TMEM256/DUF423 family)